MPLFVALQLLESETGGLFGRAVSLLNRSHPYLEKREALGAGYRLVRAPARAGAPDWARIAALAGTPALLLPDNLHPPSNAPVSSLHCPKFESRVLAATACEIVKRTRMPLYRRVAGLIDPEGQHTDLLYQLLHHYTAVQVLTNNLISYQRAATDIDVRLGAPVQYGADPALLRDCVVILAPDPAARLPKLPALPCPILCATGVSPPPGSEAFCDFRVTVSPAIAATAPSGISPHRFAAALYDYCGLDPGSHTAYRMRLGGRESDLSECVRSVMQRIGKLY